MILLVCHTKFVWFSIHKTCLINPRVPRHGLQGLERPETVQLRSSISCSSSGTKLWNSILTSNNTAPNASIRYSLVRLLEVRKTKNKNKKEMSLMKKKNKNKHTPSRGRNREEERVSVPGEKRERGQAQGTRNRCASAIQKQEWNNWNQSQGSCPVG